MLISEIFSYLGIGKEMRFLLFIASHMLTWPHLNHVVVILFPCM